MIQIGSTTYAIRTPKDLDARLIEATGCSTAEHATMLAGEPQPIHLARALHPLLHVEEGEVPDLPVLARQIAAADWTAITQQVRGLYAKAGAGE